jgi:putative oxidoreductase
VFDRIELNGGMNMRDIAVPLGRVLLALIFIMSGYGKITGWPGVVGAVEAKGLPIPMLFGAGAILAELGGGLLVALGFKARLGALMLIIFTVVTTIVFHNFWAYEGPDRQMQMINFMKNLSMTGGLLLILGYGAGPLSVDGEDDEWE